MSGRRFSPPRTLGYTHAALLWRTLLIAVLIASALTVLSLAQTTPFTPPPLAWCASEGATSYRLSWTLVPSTTDGSTNTINGRVEVGSYVFPAGTTGQLPLTALPTPRTYFRLQAVDAAGLRSGLSNEICIKTSTSGDACPSWPAAPSTCDGTDPRLPRPTVIIR